MKYNNETDKNNRIFIWNRFEQFEAFSVDTKNSLSARKETFAWFVNNIDMAVEYNICSIEDREWMLDRAEEIVSEFPEVCS